MRKRERTREKKMSGKVQHNKLLILKIKNPDNKQTTVWGKNEYEQQQQKIAFAIIKQQKRKKENEVKMNCKINDDLFIHFTTLTNNLIQL